MITYTELVSLLSYNPDMGIFTWKVNRGGRKVGDIAGTKDTYGYINISINSKIYKAHRLAWLYCFREWPLLPHIDHINGHREDNRLDNLREASVANNIRNQKLHKNSTTGIRGVSFNKNSGKFEASIKVDRVKKHLGLFDTLEEAEMARTIAANIEHKEFNNERTIN